MRPHGISPEPFPVYPPDLRHKVTVAFWTLMSFAISSAYSALLSDFCPSGHGFAIPSSRLYLTIQTLGVAIGFVGNYAPWDFHPSFGTCPSYKNSRQAFTKACLLFFSHHMAITFLCIPHQSPLHLLPINLIRFPSSSISTPSFTTDATSLGEALSPA